MKKYIVAIAFTTFASVSAQVKEINSEDQFHTASAHGAAIVKFYMPSCGYCRASAKPFAEISEQFPDVNFLEVNVDDYGDLADKYGVQGLPTFVYFKDGHKVSKSHSGFESFPKLKADIEERLNSIR